jgi:hypothetical protein
LGRTQTALTANAASLRTLANVVRAYKDRVKPEAIDAGIDEARRLLLFTLALFIGWTAVPAIGALVVGRWIRRLVETERLRPSESPEPASTIDSAES